MEIDNQKLLITNQHVAARLNSNPLAHKFYKCSNFYRTPGFAAETYPVDVALCPISEAIWNHATHEGRALLQDRFAEKHAPVAGELLFLCGFAGENSQFHFGYLNTPAQPYLTQETPMPCNFGDSSIHFALHHSPEKATSVDNSTRTKLPKPPGWSGSLVWNTRYVELSTAGKTWEPSCAQVTGILWGWPSSEACLLATKVEFINFSKLIAALSQSQIPPHLADPLE